MLELIQNSIRLLGLPEVWVSFLISLVALVSYYVGRFRMRKKILSR